MTASPTAVPPSPPSKLADGGSTLAALFAAAANSRQRQISADNIRQQQHQQRQQTPAAKASPTTVITTSNNIAASTKTKQLKRQHHQQTGTHAAQATRLNASNNVPDNNLNSSAATLIASLLNGSAKNLISSLPSSSPSSGPKSASSSSSSSLPLTKTTATFTTTVAKQQGPSDRSPAKPNQSSPKQVMIHASTETTPNPIELRNLETWYDEDEGQVDDSCYQELVDSGNTNGWSADEMFKYNEKRHKILSSYSEKTLSGEYTTPVSKAKSKTTLRMATKLAKEIEDKVIAEGRVTPESSDDDELFEKERTRRLQMKQLKQLDQLKSLQHLKSITNGTNHSQPRHSTNVSTTTNTMINKYFASTNTNYSSVNSARKSNRSSSQHSNSSATPATASLSSSPTLNDSNMIMKPVASSSRNILRACLI